MEETETIQHLFAHCQNEEVVKLRNSIEWEIKEVIKNKFGPDTAPPPVFYYNSKN